MEIIRATWAADASGIRKHIKCVHIDIVKNKCNFATSNQS